MIETHKHISDHIHILGIRPVVFVVLLVTVVLLIAFEFVLPAIVVLMVGYRYARKYKDTKLSFIDFIFYITTPGAYCISKEPVEKDEPK